MYLYHHRLVVAILALAFVTIVILPTVTLGMEVFITKPGDIQQQQQSNRDSRVYLNDIYDDFIMVPTPLQHTKQGQAKANISSDQQQQQQPPAAQFTIPNPFSSIYVSMPSLHQGYLTKTRTNDDTVVMTHQPLEPGVGAPITIWSILAWLRSPMISGFIIIFILAWILHGQFSTMSQEELREFSKLTKSFTNFKGFESPK